MKTWAIIVAAGKAERFGGTVPKQYREVCGKPVLSWTISRFEQSDSIDGILLVVDPEYTEYVTQKIVEPFSFEKLKAVVAGGASRQESVRNGLGAIPEDIDMVAIHDGARPLVRPEDINRVVSVACEHGAAILGIKATDTVKRVEGNFIIATLDRSRLFLAQTPQVFKRKLIRELHGKVGTMVLTDDASLVESFGDKVHLVEPGGPNIKITTPHDLVMVEALLSRESNG